MPVLRVWVSKQSAAYLSEIRATLFPGERSAASPEDALGLTAGSVLESVLQDEHAIIVHGHSRASRLCRRETD